MRNAAIRIYIALLFLAGTAAALEPSSKEDAADILALGTNDVVAPSSPKLHPSAGTTRVRARFTSWNELRTFLAENPGARLLSERLILRPDLLVDAASLQNLATRGVPHEVLPTPQPSAVADGLRFTNYSRRRMVTELETAAANFSQIAHLEIIGSTHEGRDLHAIKLSDQPDLDEDEPTILFVGVHHAQETIGVDCLMLLMHTLIGGYGVDPGLTELVDGCEIWLVPMLNPDGWSKLEDDGLLYWRKNCCDNNHNQAFDPERDGVDLNRNYGCHWGGVGSNDPTDADYYGRGAFSEPEVRALRTLVLAIQPSLALTYHMAGEFLIMPWACADGPPPDAVAYRALGETLAASIIRDEGSGHYDLFEGGTSGGFMDDWVYVETGGFSYTLEVSSESYPAAVDRVANNHLAAARCALERLHGPQITGLVTDAQTRIPVGARVELREISTRGVKARIADPRSGRYRRLVEPGSYTLIVTANGYESVERAGITVAAGGATVVDVELVPRPQVVLARPTPNPLRGSTTLRYFVPHRGTVRLDVYSAGGRLLRQISNRVHTIGWWEIDWDGRDQTGHAVPSGVYLCRIRHGDASANRRIVVVR